MGSRLVRSDKKGCSGGPLKVPELLFQRSNEAFALQVQRGAEGPAETMFLLTVLFACFTAADAACSCKPFETMKEAFCNSDYVLLAKVLSINNKQGELSTNATNDTKTSNDGKWSYNIWHMRTWKGDRIATSVLTTASSEDACGVPGLLEDWDYVLTGKKVKDGEISITGCDVAMPYSQLSPDEQDTFMQLMWEPEKCNEKDDGKTVKGDENSVKEADGKTVEGNDEKSVKEEGDNVPDAEDKDSDAQAKEDSDDQAEEDSDDQAED
ncbi:hypothetical protein Y032_0102g3451 [Ancylostoma ceylanicum]|uniref:NTR domain-containing protein n=1 Tax=Ancylostoma ceylanicum TaxID=53326 RepID=A0A016THB5_9BILA|nr:hypothetical protein Y032_0102g3451 [Ancylostoma ceylanicum]